MAFAEVALLVGAVIFLCFFTLGSLPPDTLLLSATDFVSSSFVSVSVLACLRLFVTSIGLAACLFLLLDGEGITVHVLTSQNTTRSIHLKHLDRFTMFTVWCWCVLTLYFFCALCCSLFAYLAPHLISMLPPLLLSSTWILFEIAFATSFLVTVVSNFVLIPGGKAKGLNVDNFFKPVPLLMHNANALFMATELLLNKIPITLRHIPYIVLFGVAYILFAWVLHEKKGVFYYFFLDYTRPLAALWYLGLMLAVYCMLYN